MTNCRRKLSPVVDLDKYDNLQKRQNKYRVKIFSFSVTPRYRLTLCELL